MAVFTSREILFIQGLGRLRIDKSATVAPQTPFCIGSTSKAFTALSLAQLADDGKLDWDTPVREYMPEFDLHDDVAARQMTARDLLSHRSGLPRHDAVWFGNDRPRAEVMKNLRHLKPYKTFRQTYQYQNLMYLAAGYLVEKITGCSWEEHVRERIFKPLGMKSSGFSFDGQLESATRARGHNTIKGKVRLLPWKPIDAAAPAGAITSTVEDMTAWLRLNLNRDNSNKIYKSIISPKSLKNLHTPIIAVPDSDSYIETHYTSYALGWNVRNYRGRHMLSHGGLVNGFSTQVILLPNDDIGAVVMTNLSASPLPQVLAYNAADRLLDMKPVDWSQRLRKEKSKLARDEKKTRDDRAKARVRRTSPTLPLEAFCGEYHHPGYGQLSVRNKGGRLRSIHNNVESRWQHYHYNMFIVDEMEYDTQYVAECSIDRKGRIGSIAIDYEPNADSIVFKRVNEDR